MTNHWKALVVVGALLLAGCSAAGQAPKVVTPETAVDFGNVPVISDMNLAKKQTFVIKNEGQGTLKLSDLQVKTLEGC
jgi:PBP1b-binding outer membrane lipoprotein LpoB